MIFDQDLLDILEGLPSESWEGEVWRYVLGDRYPTTENRRGARWNPPETAALYASFDKATVLAELDYLRALQTPQLRRSLYTLHSVRVQVDRMLHLTNLELLDSIGVGPQELASDDLSACQRVGGAAAWLGFDGIVVPSARADGNNLVIFVDQQRPDASLEGLESQPLAD